MDNSDVHDNVKMYGEEDIFLSGNPHKSHFDHEYFRYTNFSTEDMEIYPKTPHQFGHKHEFIIVRNGDLVTDLTLVINLPENFDWVDDIEDAVAKTITLIINNEIVDTITNHFLHIHNKLFNKITIRKDNKLYISLPFWFCRNIPKVLYIIHIFFRDNEVKLEIEYEELKKLVKYQNTPHNNNPTFDCHLLVEYAYVDTNERRRITERICESLIELHKNQTNTISKEMLFLNNKIETLINFEHPIKELIWAYSDDDVKSSTYFNYVSVANKLNITMDEHERFSVRSKEYFQYFQQQKYHQDHKIDDIYMYSFALKSDSLQPYGSANFSRIKNAYLVQHIDPNINKNKNYTLRIFGISYNVFRAINSNMPGLDDYIKNKNFGLYFKNVKYSNDEIVDQNENVNI
jgi:Large eukaryotic DNA virus major capsid protein/Major capsid protein N-terminus